MTRPFQCGDIVRSRRSGRIGKIDWIGETGPLCVIRATRPTDLMWYEIDDVELYDEDALARPVRRFFACIAMAAMARQAAVGLAISMTSAQARVMADWLGTVSPDVDHHWSSK